MVDALGGGGGVVTVGEMQRAAEERARRAAALGLRDLAWWRRALLFLPRPTPLWLLAVFFAAKAIAFMLYGRTILHATSCSLRGVEEPLWDVHYTDWRETLAFTSEDELELREFLARGRDVPLRRLDAHEAPTGGDAPLLLGYATAESAALAHHWACRARAAALAPRVISLDGAPTCRALAAAAAWLPCLALETPHQHGSVAQTTDADAAHASEHARHLFLMLRARISWRILALGHDALFSDTDVVFAPNASLRLADFLPRASVQEQAPDLVTLEHASSGLSGKLVRAAVSHFGFAYPNFGLVYARANARTVAFFQLLHWSQGVARAGAAATYDLCMRAPWRRLRVAHFSRDYFVDGAYWHQRAARRGALPRPVAVHLSSLLPALDADAGTGANATLYGDTMRQKVRLLGAWGLWEARCGGDAPLPYETSAPAPGTPRLFDGALK